MKVSMLEEISESVIEECLDESPPDDLSEVEEKTGSGPE